jgi:SAM-dependent methyltransferase
MDCNTSSSTGVDPGYHRFQKERMDHWDRVSSLKEKRRRPGAFYHKLLHHYYRFFIPEGLRVLELGCGYGDLLAALKPSLGVGIDFSSQMIRQASQKHPHLHFVRADVHQIPIGEKFDVILLSDLVNDLWDVQEVFAQLTSNCHSRTRMVLNFYNNLWRIPLSVVRRLGLGADVLEQNWFSPQDVFNLLRLSDFDIIKHRPAILLPLSIPLLSKFANRYLAVLPPFSWFALVNLVVARSYPFNKQSVADGIPSVAVIVPARNEGGNIEQILKRMTCLGKRTEIIFVEGHSTDDTYKAIQQTIERFPEKKCRLFRQPGKGKGDAVRLGFEKAESDLLIILDADMGVPPEDLPRFLEPLLSGKGEFVNGVRLVYPMEEKAMRFFNIAGNKFFSLAFSWLLGQPIKDTLCGTKALWKRDYELLKSNRGYSGDFDPFGDFDLLFGAAKLNLKIVEMPVRYRSRTYGTTNIDRWLHGWLLLKMVAFAARHIKFI